MIQSTSIYLLLARITCTDSPLLSIRPYLCAQTAISAKSAQKFALFAICALIFQQSLSFIINNLKNRMLLPADFLRTLSHTFSKSPQESIFSTFLPEDQCSILITQHGGSGACGGMAETFPPLPPFRHMSFS